MNEKYSEPAEESETITVSSPEARPIDEWAAADESATPHLVQRVERILESGKTFTNEEIVCRLNEDGYGQANPHSVRGCLSDAFQSKRIRRLRKGLYASMNLPEEDIIPPNLLTLEEGVAQIVNEASEPLSNSAIFDALTNEDFEVISLKDANKIIARICKMGLIKRLRRGLYAAPDYTGPLPKPERKKEAPAPVFSLKSSSPSEAEAEAEAEAKRYKKDGYYILRRKAKLPSQSTIGIGRKISKIIDSFEGDITVDEVFEELAGPDCKDFNRQNFEPLVASVIRRTQKFYQLKEK